MSIEYGRLMRKVSNYLSFILQTHDLGFWFLQRLALRRTLLTDESEHFKPLLDLMETHKLDFHTIFRTLCSFRPSMLPADTTKEANARPSPIEAFVTKLLAATPDPQRLDHRQAASDWLAWLDKYAKRIGSEREEWGSDMDEDREKAARAANPRFVLRQWVLEEVIKKVEQDAGSGKRVLAKVMHVRSFFDSSRMMLI